MRSNKGFWALTDIEFERLISMTGCERAKKIFIAARDKKKNKDPLIQITAEMLGTVISDEDSPFCNASALHWFYESNANQKLFKSLIGRTTNLSNFISGFTAKMLTTQLTEKADSNKNTTPLY